MLELKKCGCPRRQEKSQYGYRAIGGILGIVLLMTALLFMGTFLSLSLGLPQQTMSVTSS